MELYYTQITGTKNQKRVKITSSTVQKVVIIKLILITWPHSTAVTSAITPAFYNDKLLNMTTFKMNYI